MKYTQYVKLGILSGALMTSACFFDSKDEYKADTAKAEAQKSEATGSLNSAIDGIVSGENLDITDFDASDFKSAKEHYDAALKANKNDSEAKFGRALTGVMAAIGEPRMNDVMTEVTGDQNPAIELTSSNSKNMNASIAKLAVASNEEFPTVSYLQDEISAVLLPALDLAISDLESVVKDQNFSMEMEIDGQTRMVGPSEANILLAGFRMTRVQLTLVLSRNFDVDQDGSYQYLEALEQPMGDDLKNNTLTQSQKNSINTILSFMKTGSPFLTVRKGWEDRFKTLLPEIKKATQNLEDAVVGLPKQGSYILSKENIRPSERQDILKALDSVQYYLENPVSVELDAGDQITVYLPALLEVQDLKKLLPHYDFYTSDQWATKEGFFYFTDGTKKTGDLKSIANIQDQDGLTNFEEAKKLKEIIYFQDPTFNGALPGMTRAKLWTIILNNAKYEDQQEQFYW